MDEYGNNPNWIDYTQGGLGAVAGVAPLIPFAAPIAPYALAGVAVITLVRGLFTKKPKPNPQSVSVTNPVELDRALPVVYGTVEIVPGTVYMNANRFIPLGQSYRMFAVYDICHGPISKIGKVRFTKPENTVFINEDGTMGEFTEERPMFGEDEDVQTAFSSIHTGSFHLGTDDQTVDAIMTANFPTEWPSTMRGRGIAYMVLRLENDLRGNPWRYGMTQVMCNVQGRLLADPRNAMSASFSDNPALAVLDYLTNDRYGWGIDISEIDTGSFVSASNHCDETIDIALYNPFGWGKWTTEQPRYSCNGILDTSRTLQDNTQLLLTSCGGNLTLNNGKLFMYIPQSQSVSGLHITPMNTLGTHTITMKGADEMINEIHGFYLKSGSLGQFVPAEVRLPTGSDAENPYLALDNDYPLVASYNLPFTTDQTQAERLMSIALKRNRQRFSMVRTCNEELLQAVPGTILEVTDPTMEWDRKQFEVVMTRIPAEAQIELTMVSYDIDDFNEILTEKPADENIGFDSAFEVPYPINITITAPYGGDRAEVLWSTTGSGDIHYFECAARKISGSVLAATDQEWRVMGTPPADSPRSFILGVRDGDYWQARVRTFNRLGVYTAWYTSSVTEIQVHEKAVATYGTPLIFTGSVQYPVTQSATCAYVRFYHRQGTTGSIDDPELNELYFAGDLVYPDSIFTITQDGNNRYFKTIPIAYNRFGEPNYDQDGMPTASFYSELPTGTASTLAAPSGLSSSVTTNSISMSWTNNETAQTELWLDGVYNTTKAVGVTSHNFTGLSSGQLYAMKARHVVAGLYSAFSPTHNNVTSTATLDAPTLYGYNPAEVGTNSIALYWTPGANNSTANASFVIETSEHTSGSWSQLGTAPAGSTTFSDEDDLKSGSVYDFRIKATKKGWTDSDYSNTVAIMYSSIAYPVE